MTGLSITALSRAVPGFASSSNRWPHRKTLAPGNNKGSRRLVAGRLSHYSALYEVQHDQGSLPLEAVQHLHHMVHGGNNTLGPLYLATFCALSVTLGALLYNLTNVLNEYFALQQHLTKQQEDKPLLFGVDVSSSKMFKSQRVRAAAAFAAKAHAGQMRKTGEPYVTHCIETALIVESNLPHWRQDSRHETAIIAALLHDVLDDTPTTPEALSASFGPTVTAMVVSVSKLSAVNQMLRRDKRKGVVRRDQSFWQLQWRRLKRMMFEAVVEEPLVILVKLADRLHNLRTVYALPPAKQQAVAEETLAVWCSMAASLGWHSLKSEMEDLCFAVLDTSTFCALRQELDKLWSSPPPPRRRRVKSSRRQLQLQQFAEQQQELAAARAAKWGQGLLRRLQQGLGIRRSWTTQPSSSGGEPGALAGGEGHSSSSSGVDASAAAAVGPQQQQQQQHGGGLNLLLHGLWPSGSSTSTSAAAGSGRSLLPAPPLPDSEGGRAPGGVVTSHEEPKRPSGADWGVTDAALSLRSLLGTTLGSSSSSSGSSVLVAVGAVEPPGAQPEPAKGVSSSSSKGGNNSSSGSKGQLLSPQQQQLRNILSTVVPFDAVSLTGSNPGLTWSAQQGLGVLKEAAGRLYNELAVGSFSGGLKVEIQGRLKSLRSVHTKMERKQCSVEEVYDARALRVVVDDGGGERLADAVQCCYRLVSAVHKLWRPIHGEFDDYIANPKPSGYQALHTAVWGPGGAALEVQIKTAGMHEHAEYGGAAHWQYKEVLWGSAPAAAAAVDNVERNVAAAAAAAAAAASGSSAVAGQEQRSLADGAAAAVAAAAAAARRSSNVQVLPTVLFTFDDDGQLLSSSGSSSVGSSGSGYAASPSGFEAEPALLKRASARAAVAAAAAAPARTMQQQHAGRSGAGGVQLAERPRLPTQQLVSAAAAASAGRQTATALSTTKGSAAVSTLERLPLSLPASQLGRQQQQQVQLPRDPPQQQQPQRPVPAVYVGQPVLRISDRLRYGVVLATSHSGGSSGGPGTSSSSSGRGSSLLQLSPEAAAAQLGLSAAGVAASATTITTTSSSSSSSTITCVIMSGGTNPDHPWRMPDYGFYEQLLQYASAQGWLRPGQGDWHARLEEYEWCRDCRWHRRDHMGYLHPHTTLTLLEGYEQDAVEAAAAATPAATAAATTPAAGTYSLRGTGSSLRNTSSSSGGSSSSGSSSAGASPTALMQEQGLLARSASGSLTRATPADPRTAPDAAMLRHSWATGGTGSTWRQQQQQQAAAAVPASCTAAAVAVPGSTASGVSGEGGEQSGLSASNTSSTSSSSGGSVVSASDDGNSSSSGSGDAAPPVFAGTAAAAGSDWAATAAKAAQLRSVIEWGLEAYGVNAAGSEPSAEVSVVIWPGGSIEDVPRGTTAGQILREKGVFAIMDAAAAAGGASSSDSDADTPAQDAAAADAEVGVGGSAGRTTQQQPAAAAVSAADAQQQQQQQLVNVNNRLVSEDTVLQDGDLVILAREKIKI